MLSVRVVKLGGNELDRPEWVAACADALRSVGPVVLVHGGGEAVSALSQRLALPVEKRDGRRVTSPEVAEAVEMVLAGPVNRMLVAALRRAGLDAIGLSGVDGGLLTAQRAPGGLGHVGEIVAVRVSLLHSLLLAGLTPVIAPMAPAAEGGLPFNVNADDAAAAVAGALHATELLFVSDVPGVTVDGTALIAEDGTRYLDFVAGIGVNALGYNHPVVRAAVEHALATGLIHVSNLYRTEPAERLAEELVARSFADRVFFCNSGAEANEAAFKFARKWSGKSEIVAFTGSFHGRLFATLAATDRPEYRKPFEPLVPGIRIVPREDWAAVDHAVSASRTAAVIVEPDTAWYTAAQ